jgi:hypothetical protein
VGMDRAASLGYLQEQHYGPIEAVSGVTSTDNAAGYKSALDDAALTMGIAYDDLPSFEVTDNILGFRPTLQYYALKSHSNALVAKLSYNIGSAIQEMMSNVLKQVKEAMAIAKTEALVQGVVIVDEGGSIVDIGELDLDIYEPAVSETGA